MQLKQIQINDQGIIDASAGDWFDADQDLIDQINTSTDREYVEGWGKAIERVTVLDPRFRDKQHFFVSE